MSKEQFATEPSETSSESERNSETTMGAGTGTRPVGSREQRESNQRGAASEPGATDTTSDGTETETTAATDTDDATRTISLGIGLGIELDVDPDPDETVETVEIETTETALGEPRSNATFEPSERAELEAADVDPDAVASKEYSYRMLLETEIDEDVAATLRRRFSLPWSFETDGDLDRRSDEVRGLGAAERAWIAASDDETWQTLEGTPGRPEAFDCEPVRRTDENGPGSSAADDRPWPRPTPTTAVTGVGPADAETLADAGIVSAKRLATIDAGEVARLLELDVRHVRTWRHNARELAELE